MSTMFFFDRLEALADFERFEVTAGSSPEGATTRWNVIGVQHDGATWPVLDGLDTQAHAELMATLLARAKLPEHATH